MYVYIYIYIHTYIHIHIYTHTWTYVPTYVPALAAVPREEAAAPEPDSTYPQISYEYLLLVISMMKLCVYILCVHTVIHLYSSKHIIHLYMLMICRILKPNTLPSIFVGSAPREEAAAHEQNRPTPFLLIMFTANLRTNIMGFRGFDSSVIFSANLST